MDKTDQDMKMEIKSIKTKQKLKLKAFWKRKTQEFQQELHRQVLTTEYKRWGRKNKWIH